MLVTPERREQLEAVPGPRRRKEKPVLQRGGTAAGITGKGFAFANGRTISRLFRYDGASGPAPSRSPGRTAPELSPSLSTMHRTALQWAEGI